ncbi:MAG: AAA family ATPase [Methylocella sp.]
MLFRRIAVRNFRKLVSPVMIDGLGEGVTIIAGDNEEGKSTLLDAIRTGLFERHNLGGKAADDMQPFGSSVRPEIRLDFEIDGKTYSITKCFAQKASARLTTPNGIYEGPAADEQLGKLLTFRVPQRGESKTDDQGILGLFWLDQGRALEGLRFGETGRSTLRASLEEKVGDVLGGTRGPWLLEAAKGKRDALLTATGKPTGQLKEAINGTADAAARVTGYETQRREYDQDIDELARLRRELARITSDCVLEKARDDLANVEKQVKAIEAFRQQDEMAGQSVSLAKAEFENISNRVTRRRALIEALVRQELALESSRAIFANLEIRTQDVASRVDAARAALGIAEKTRSDGEARVEKSQIRARAGALDKEIAELQRRLTEVETLVAQRSEAQERLTGIKIDKKLFERIQSLESDLRDARAALGVIATRLRFLPSASQAIRQDDNEVPARDEIEVTEATRFALEGFGAVEVAPGASELVDRRAELKKAEDKLNKALAAAGVEIFAQAKAQFTTRMQAEASINEAMGLIKAYAPEGIDALRAAHRDGTAEREQLRERLDLFLLEKIADPEIEARALASAKSGEGTARMALDAAQKEQHQHDIQLAVTKKTVAAENVAVDAAKSDLEAARKEIDDKELVKRLETARGVLAGTERRKAETEGQLAAANPAEVELRKKRATETLQTVEAEQRRLREQNIATEGRLEGLGQNGIGELLDIARGQRDQAIAHRDHLHAEAEAWNLLVATLSSAERDAKEAFLEPVLSRVDPFLRLLLPDVSVKLHPETLEIDGLTRDGRKEPYEKLSGGMREQLSILVRLAFAVYLREKGYPAAVILDDALVYADPDRFDRMQLALRKAAETVQILILTCNPGHWRQIGAPIRRLADAGARAFEPA